MQRIAVIDYGMGNLRSVAKALEHVAGRDASIVVSDDRAVIAGADRVVFPGQGAARDCMGEIESRALGDAVAAAAASKPFLGICMGLQVLLDRSEEHDTTCLGLLPGTVRHFPPGESERLSIPQMGWNRVRFARTHPLWSGIADETHFYFANSYYAAPEQADVVAATTTYGVDFASAIARGNLFAVQFHPEKSQHAGLRLLENFLAWEPN